ncbi:uncharacterized protein LOC111705912 isoform X3 [Eurytemora carolleeae]|uniref:uncharacterized protein LOC111705912 isoform X3 n=1 Tax=Eurytemora carolleeae TaxID=1294199 RepID=UPI000C765B90|nr:uncharacterized protein LOC111705912 isoform X3 [Eurytemora carolleeae]|eukprot:XP_023334386.1 uncharacterized protein LOC111705912 isoform X3 [Eurytemora affinis]
MEILGFLVLVGVLLLGEVDHCSFTDNLTSLLSSFSSSVSLLRVEGRMSGSDMSGYTDEDVNTAKQLPKVELHLHLDGSLSPEFIGRRALARGIQLPVPPEQLRQFLMMKKLEKLNTDGNKAEKGGNWPVFDFCNQFLQTKEELSLGTLDLLDRLAQENVVYAEIRFCPFLHTKEGLTEAEVVEAVLEGARGQRKVKTGLILVALRSKNSDHGISTAQLAFKYLQKSSEDMFGVVGMDVAGDEGTYPLCDPSHAMYAGVQEAKRLGVPLTVHAGEWPEKYGSIENLRWAINQGVRRIGHGIAVRSDAESLRLLEKNNMTVEVCLTSNVGNGFKENYVKYSLSSDNLLLSGDLKLAPSPTLELLRLAVDVGLGWEEARNSLISGLESAFSPCIGRDFINDIQDRIDKIIHQ